MKKLFSILLAAALVLSFAACKKGTDGGNESSDDQSQETGGTQGTQNSTDGTDVQDNKKTPELGEGYGEYTEDGKYDPPETLDGKDVLYYGSYSPDAGVTVTVTDAGNKVQNNAQDKPGSNQSEGKPDNSGKGSETEKPSESESETATEKESEKESEKETEKETEKESEKETEKETDNVNPPAEDIYKKALDSLGSYNCNIDFCYYVDMSDGWHEKHPSATTVSYDASSGRYTGKSADESTDNTAIYEKGLYTSPNGSKSGSSIDVFYRQCNYLTPLELNSYNFTATSDKTVVSAFLPASDYRYKLMMASNFFKGYEKEDRSDITMGDLVYTATLNAEGKLTATEFDYKFTVSSKNIGDMNITVVVKTKYE